MPSKQVSELRRKYSKENSMFVIEEKKEVRLTDFMVVKQSGLLFWLLLLTLGMASKLII